MKSIWTCFVLGIVLTPVIAKHEFTSVAKTPLPVARNLFVITVDGFRWQELFNGADSSILHSEKYTPDHSTISLQYWAASAKERREKLMPFFWKVIAAKGQVFGNRRLHNKVDAANLYSLSYPGYNEMFTGNTDMQISSNRKKRNPNINVFEYLNGQPDFTGKVAVFSSWDVFPYILNSERNGLPVNSGYVATEGETDAQQLINTVQRETITDKKSTRYDQLTFLAAREYLQINKPRVFCLGLGETDEYAHDGRYDLYLQQASQVDRMIADLWHWVQTTPGYKNNTTFIITTDHGRGSRTGNWTSHGEFISGSSQAWFAVMGPGIEPAGEIKSDEQHYLQQLAQTMAGVVGQEFKPAEAPAIALH